MARILVTLYTYPTPKAYSSKILSDKRLLADTMNYPLAGRVLQSVDVFGAMSSPNTMAKHYVWTPSGCKHAKVDENLVSTFGLHSGHLGASYWIVDDDAIQTLGIDISLAPSPKVNAPLCACDQCGEVNPWGEPNTAEGTYRCYSCRQDPYRCCFASSD